MTQCDYCVKHIHHILCFYCPCIVLPRVLTEPADGTREVAVVATEYQHPTCTRIYGPATLPRHIPVMNTKWMRLDPKSPYWT